MSGKNKLQKFAQLNSYKNVYQNFDHKESKLTSCNNEEIDLKGLWNEKHFKNQNQLILELACGGGEYTIELAQRHPDINYIGVDIKGARIHKGATYGMENNIENAAFLRTRIEKIDKFFAPGEVDEIWITFPDPFLKDKKENRRLTSANFLNIFKKILNEKHLIHLKTDSEPLYEYSLESLNAFPNCNIIYHNEDIYASELYTEELSVKTKYEKRHLQNNLTIKYIRFSLEI